MQIDAVQKTEADKKRQLKEIGAAHSDTSYSKRAVRGADYLLQMRTLLQSVSLLHCQPVAIELACATEGQSHRQENLLKAS